MAELISSTGKSGGRHQSRLPVRVDLTALVDLAFLLITFFMLTTTLLKPKVMPLVMPVGPSAAVAQSSTMTICIGRNQALCYLGMADKPLISPKQVAFGDDLQQTILQTGKRVFAATGKSMMVVIKPSQHSIYKNLVNTLDELNITQTSRYAIAAISPKDIDMLKQKGIY